MLKNEFSLWWGTTTAVVYCDKSKRPCPIGKVWWLLVVLSPPLRTQKLERRANTKCIVSKNASLTHFWWGGNKETNICLLFIRFLQLLRKLPTLTMIIQLGGDFWIFQTICNTVGTLPTDRTKVIHGNEIQWFFSRTLMVRGMQNSIWNSAFVLPRAKEVLIATKVRYSNAKNVELSFCHEKSRWPAAHSALFISFVFWTIGGVTALCIFHCRCLLWLVSNSIIEI